MEQPSAPPRVEAPSLQARRSARGGVLYGAGAFLWWGLIPLYFNAIAAVPPLEVLAHRVLWSAVIFSVLLLARGRAGSVRVALQSRRTLITLLGSTVLVASNWLIFIWAVGHKHTLEASLGYFINPLLNVLLGYVFLHERLSRPQKLSVALVSAGVLYLTMAHGRLPAVAVMLALTFGLYALLRKVAHVDALVGLTVETTLLAPIAIAYMFYAHFSGSGRFLAAADSRRLDVLLLMAGVITAVPLLWFVNAARRLRLATVGLLQYLAPTVQLLVAVLVFGEAFTRKHGVCFGLVWAGLMLYTIDTVRKSMGEKAPAGSQPAS